MKLRDLINSIKVPAPPRSKQRGRVPGLMAERINRWLRDRPALKVEDILPHAAFLSDQVKFHFCRQFSAAGEQKWHIRPSGQKCTRDEALKKLGYFSMPSEMAGTFFAGDFAEAYGITLGLLAGCKLSDFQKTVQVPPGIRGHIDCILTIGKKRYLVDFKSASRFAFQKAGISEDIWGYYRQLKTYMMAEELEDVVGGLLVYINKENWRDFKEVPVPVPTEEDRQVWEEHCRAIQSCRNTDTLPPRPEWATTRESTLRKPVVETVEVLEDIRCKLCGNLKACWGDGWELRPGKDNEWIRR